MTAENKFDVEQLVAKLDSEDREIRVAAIQLLGESLDADIFPLLLEALKNPDSFVRHYAASYLVKYGDKRALEPLIQSIPLWKGFWQRLPVVESIVEFGEEGLLTLISHFNNPEASIRVGVAYGLGLINDSRSEIALLKMINDPYWEVRYGVYDALANIGTPLSLEPLLEALRNVTEEKAYREISCPLGMICQRYTSDLLVEAIKNTDEKEKVRYWLALALGDSEKVENLPTLIELILDKSNLVRKGAVTALGYLRSKDAIPALNSALTDEDEAVRAAAVEALNTIKKAIG